MSAFRPTSLCFVINYVSKNYRKLNLAPCTYNNNNNSNNNNNNNNNNVIVLVNFIGHMISDPF